MLQDLSAKKLGLAVALSLSGKRREITMEVGGETLESENGLKDLLEKLYSIFGKETVDQSYEMYTSYEVYMLNLLRKKKLANTAEENMQSTKTD